MFLINAVSFAAKVVGFVVIGAVVIDAAKGWLSIAKDVRDLAKGVKNPQSQA